MAIARALANEPKVLLADEPTGSLDSESTEHFLRLLDRLGSAGMTIVMVTHDLEVAAHAHRIITMRDGRVVAEERSGHGKTTSPTEVHGSGSGGISVEWRACSLQRGVIPHEPVHRAPGVRTTTSVPERNASGGQDMGSTASAVRRSSGGSVSPE